MTQDKMVVWHQLDEFEQAPGVGDGQGSMAVHAIPKSWTQLSD